MVDPLPAGLTVLVLESRQRLPCRSALKGDIMSRMCHSHLQLPADNSKLNMTHTIHSVHFGPHFPGQVNPLDGKHNAMEGSVLLASACCPHLSARQSGHRFPAYMQTGPGSIAGYTRRVNEETGVFNYFIKVVPTVYRKSRGQLLL